MLLACVMPHEGVPLEGGIQKHGSAYSMLEWQVGSAYVAAGRISLRGEGATGVDEKIVDRCFELKKPWNLI